MANRRLATLFNFFESYGTESLEEFLKSWRGTCQTFLVNKDNFIRTQLHKNLDETGGVYKYFNYAHFTNDEFAGFRREFATPEWIAEIQRGNKAGYVAYPGGYHEIATFTGEPMAPALPDKETSVFLVSNFKVAEAVNLQDLEANWQEWSGVQSLSKHTGLGFKNAALFSKFTEKSPSPFRYVVRTEFTDFGNDLKEALELVKGVREMKTPGMTVDTSLYKALSECIYEQSK